MLTLTLKYDKKTSLSDRIVMLWQFRKQLYRELRNGFKVRDKRGVWHYERRPFKIRNWVACIEVPNHMHIIFDAEFIPQSVIADIWEKITKDSFIVDIREVVGCDDNVKKAVAYITKYVTKITFMDDVHLDALKGFHLVNSDTSFDAIRHFPGLSWYKLIDVWEYLAVEGDYYYDDAEPEIFGLDRYAS